jgi:hypothetical protein
MLTDAISPAPADSKRLRQSGEHWFAYVALDLNGVEAVERVLAARATTEQSEPAQ